MQTAALHILLIDDIKTDIEEITNQLGQTIASQFSLTHFSDMRESVECIKSNHPEINVIVLDLGLLSDCSPQEIFSVVKNVAKQIPIIVITGKEEHDLAIFVMNAGAADNMTRGNFSNAHGKLGDAIEFSLVRSRILKDSRKLTTESENLREQLMSYIGGGYSYGV